MFIRAVPHQITLLQICRIFYIELELKCFRRTALLLLFFTNRNWWLSGSRLQGPQIPSFSTSTKSGRLDTFARPCSSGSSMMQAASTTTPPALAISSTPAPATSYRTQKGGEARLRACSPPWAQRRHAPPHRALTQRSTGGDQVVHQHHALPLLHRIGVHLDAIRAVLCDIVGGDGGACRGGVASEKARKS